MEKMQTLVYFVIVVAIKAKFRILIVLKNRCRIPAYPDDTYAVQNENHSRLINASIPTTTGDNADLVYDKCSYYVINISDVTAGRGEKRNCDSWIYERTVYHSTFTDQV